MAEHGTTPNGMEDWVAGDRHGGDVPDGRPTVGGGEPSAYDHSISSARTRNDTDNQGGRVNPHAHEIDWTNT